MTTAIQHRAGSLQSTTQHDYILLDGSASMQSQWWDSLDAIQAYIDGVRAANINSQVILHIFDTIDRDLIVRNVPIDQWTSLKDDPVGSHFGGTPLYDAIELMGRRLRDLDPPRASIVIVTDGDDFDSKTCNLTRAKSILDWMRAKGWQVTFIGANFNNEKQAGLLGGQPTSMIGVERKQLTNAAKSLAKKRANYGTYGTPMHFNDDEKEQFGGYLTKG